MFDTNEMLQHEVTFCELFTGKTVTDWGVLYCNPDNPRSYDSNHAHVLDIRCDLERAVEGVTEFYHARGVVPRIYQSFVEGELVRLQPVLTAYGFTVQTQVNAFMLFDPQRTPAAAITPQPINVRRVDRLSADILELDASDADKDWGEWSVKVMEISLRQDRYHLLGSYVDDKCVALASVQVMDGYSRVDDVKTHAAFRGLGYGTRLINRLTAYHSAISGNYLYLYANNPIAIRMYHNTGFQDVAVDKPCWTAWIGQPAATPAPSASAG